MLNPVKFISKFFRSTNQRELDRIQKIVEKVNKCEESIIKLKDEDFPKKSFCLPCINNNNISVLYYGTLNASLGNNFFVDIPNGNLIVYLKYN